MDCLLIEDSIVLVLTGLFDSNGFNIKRVQSYLRSLGLNWGIAVNFGKSEAQFTAVREDA